jgi:hypothetical protein
VAPVTQLQYGRGESYSDEQIKELITRFPAANESIFTPVIREARKDIMGSYSTNYFAQAVKVRVNGEVQEHHIGYKLDHKT